jgi:hypothetical protein
MSVSIGTFIGSLALVFYKIPRLLALVFLSIFLIFLRSVYATHMPSSSIADWAMADAATYSWPVASFAGGIPEVQRPVPTLAPSPSLATTW